MIGPEASSFCIASVHRSACSSDQTLSTPVSVDMLNQPLSLPQPFSWPIHGCDVVPSLLYAVFYARLSSPSQSLSQLLSWPPHSSLIRHQTIAAACIFLATKTEECGRKLRDVARVCQSKAKGIDVRDIPESGPVRLFFVIFLVLCLRWIFSLVLLFIGN